MLLKRTDGMKKKESLDNFRLPRWQQATYSAIYLEQVLSLLEDGWSLSQNERGNFGLSKP